jgi:hypothetical protein
MRALPPVIPDAPCSSHRLANCDARLCFFFSSAVPWYPFWYRDVDLPVRVAIRVSRSRPAGQLHDGIVHFSRSVYDRICLLHNTR